MLAALSRQRPERLRVGERCAPKGKRHVALDRYPPPHDVWSLSCLVWLGSLHNELPNDSLAVVEVDMDSAILCWHAR